MEDEDLLAASCKSRITDLLTSHGIIYRDDSAEWAEHLDFALTVPAQEKFSFELSINFQNADEIHLSAKDFVTSHFPVSKNEKFTKVLAILEGLICGTMRIRCFYFNQGSFIDSRLERLVGAKWEPQSHYGQGCNFLSKLGLRPKPAAENTMTYWNNPDLDA
jgi:hypothetical protein